jgi:hypothetical protein
MKTCLKRKIKYYFYKWIFKISREGRLRDEKYIRAS